MKRSSDLPGPRAELAAFAAKLNAIFERGREEALNPTNPELRAWNEANFAAQHDGGAGIDLSGIAEAKAAAAIDRENRRVPWAQRIRETEHTNFSGLADAPLNAIPSVSLFGARTRCRN